MNGSEGSQYRKKTQNLVKPHTKKKKTNQGEQLYWIENLKKIKELKINISLKPIIINRLNSPSKIIDWVKENKIFISVCSL